MPVGVGGLAYNVRWHGSQVHRAHRFESRQAGAMYGFRNRPISRHGSLVAPFHGVCQKPSHMRVASLASRRDYRLCHLVLAGGHFGLSRRGPDLSFRPVALSWSLGLVTHRGSPRLASEGRWLCVWPSRARFLPGPSCGGVSAQCRRHFLLASSMWLLSLQVHTGAVSHRHSVTHRHSVRS